MISKAQINSLANSISKKFGTRKIFLFGSYAYGQPSSFSDIDFCVIANFGNKRKIDVIRDIRREIGRYLQNPLDILLYGEEEFNERAKLKNTLEYKILRYGILIDE